MIERDRKRGRGTATSHTPMPLPLDAKTTKVVFAERVAEFPIAESARRHFVNDEEIRHAIRNRVRVYELENFVMIIGASASGRMLEIGANPYTCEVVHAMDARRKFWP